MRLVKRFRLGCWPLALLGEPDSVVPRIDKLFVGHCIMLAKKPCCAEPGLLRHVAAMTNTVEEAVDQHEIVDLASRPFKTLRPDNIGSMGHCHHEGPPVHMASPMQKDPKGPNDGAPSCLGPVMEFFYALTCHHGGFPVHMAGLMQKGPQRAQ